MRSGGPATCCSAVRSRSRCCAASTPATPTFLARFRAEAQHAASLSHPNIAAVFDYGEETAEDGTGEHLAYLVMELVEGEPLSALLAREGPLDTGATLSLLRQTAFGLAGRTRRAWCTATSSRATSWSARTAS